MVERFLQYSIQHQRKITLIVQDEKGIRRMNVTVTKATENDIEYLTARSRKEKKLLRACILAADYARGDDGDTLARENAQNAPNSKI